MQTRFRWLSIGVLVAASACSSRALARAGHVFVRLEPDTVAAGESATLTVSSDDDLGVPTVPQVSGLDIQSIGQRTNMTMINGVTQRSVSYLYQVRAQHPGEFTIDGIHAGASNAPPLTLHVQAGAAGRSSGAFQASAPVSPGAPNEHPSDLAFMRLHVDKQRLYVGQSVPFTVQAYFRGGTGVTMKARPELSSDAFTVSGLDETPTQNQVTLAGVPYLAVTWRGTMTAVKAGQHPLDMSLPVSLQYREVRPEAASHRRSLRDVFGGNSPIADMLQDPMFDSMLDQPMFDGFLEPGPVVTRDITLRGRDGQAHALALPEPGKPADFSGAVGQFELHASLPDAPLTRGEPVDLRFTITGKGNFGQFKSAGLPESDTWKAYAVHDTFHANDKLGLSGSSEYVQPIAAQRDGALEVPGLRFSYFDPIAQHYVTKTTPAIAVHVAAAAEASATPPSAATPAPAAGSEETAVRSLARGGVPAWLAPLGAAALLLALLSACGVHWWRSSQRQRLFERRRAARSIADQRQKMLRAAREGDRIAYLRSGRHALQQRLAETWHVAPDSITLHELDLRWPSVPGDIRRVFELADQAEYAGGRLQSTPELDDLPTWSRTVDSQIAHMEVPS